MTSYKYKAFISYSHIDARVSKQLLSYLERFKIPENLIDDYAHIGSTRTLGRIFRDREQLAASDSLEDEIKKNVGQSEFLIVLCSPASAQSSRVAFEIKTFLETNDQANIICLIVDGEPDFTTTPGIEGIGCVPLPLKSLHQLTGKTPLAADLRVNGDGSTLAFKKIIAAMLKVDLDKLMQREARRLQRRVIAVGLAGTAVAFVLMGLVVSVQLAKNAEEDAKHLALEQQKRAEDLVSFMVDDLVIIKLQQLGRVEVIDAVVEKLIGHYVKQDDRYLPLDGLARKAHVFMQLGRVYIRRQQAEQAKNMFDHADMLTKKLINQYPRAIEVIYSRSQALYWMGRYELLLGNFATAEEFFRERLTLYEPFDAVPNKKYNEYADMADIHVHMGWVLMERGAYGDAKALFEKGFNVRKSVAERFQADISWLNSVAGAYHHLAWAEEYLGNTDRAIEHSKNSIVNYQKIWDADPLDQRAHANLARSLRWLAESEYGAGQYEKAKVSILRALEHYKPIMQFEPDDEDKQLQYCWSAVQYTEIQEKLGEYDPAEKVLENLCPYARAILQQDHVKAYNRLLSYRADLVKLSYLVRTENIDADDKRLVSLTEVLHAENPEVMLSAMGRRIKLRHALTVLKAEKAKNAPIYSDIKKSLQEFDEKGNIQHVETSEMLNEARHLFLSIDDE